MAETTGFLRPSKRWMIVFIYDLSADCCQWANLILSAGYFASFHSFYYWSCHWYQVLIKVLLSFTVLKFTTSQQGIRWLFCSFFEVGQLASCVSWKLFMTHFISLITYSMTDRLLVFLLIHFRFYWIISWLITVVVNIYSWGFSSSLLLYFNDAFELCILGQANLQGFSLKKCFRPTQLVYLRPLLILIFP